MDRKVQLSDQPFHRNMCPCDDWKAQPSKHFRCHTKMKIVFSAPGSHSNVLTVATVFEFRDSVHNFSTENVLPRRGLPRGVRDEVTRQAMQIASRNSAGTLFNSLVEPSTSAQLRGSKDKVRREAVARRWKYIRKVQFSVISIKYLN